MMKAVYLMGHWQIVVIVRDNKDGSDIFGQIRAKLSFFLRFYYIEDFGSDNKLESNFRINHATKNA